MISKKYPQNGKFLYNIAMREPYHLPDEVIKLPAPPQAPGNPPSANLLMLILPPVLMILGTVISVSVGGMNPITMIPMVLMGMGLPMANLANVNIQKKKYKEALVKREQDYKKVLSEYRKRIEGMIAQQRIILEKEFPNATATLEIGNARGKNKRLWWRRPGEQDFLRLRLGCGEASPSFKIEAPNMLSNQDNLSDLPFELIETYRRIENVPFLVDFKHIGSLTLCANSILDQIRFTRRLLTDVIVHHSPEDVELFIISDHQKAAETWEWLRWAPHMRTLEGGSESAHLLFDKDKINAFLDSLKRIFFERLEKVRGYSSNESYIPLPAMLVVMDDIGAVRQHPDIARIAAEGYTTGIYLIFMSNEKVPRTCRARIELDKNQRLNYLETIESTGLGDNRQGVAELLRGKEVNKLSRDLAGLAVAGGERSIMLPPTVRITSILNNDPLNIDTIISNWLTNTRDSDQVLLPVGQWIDRTGLATYEIDFRPEALGGKGAYHAMMIGTTGSGKSIFMQSMVLAAAHRYSPKQINFLFMDFKAGAAELKKVSDLPHSVGMITDLSPALAERALQALENELSRRKFVFDSAGKITDIWDFNRRFPESTIPHLLVVIDEFTEGINILPNLVERLRELGRQGRAFGMYFFLANQEVNSAVDSLKANVSWYVLLKVNRQEEMSLIGRNYPVPSGRGHGYVKVKSEVTTIRGAYAGLPANAGDQDENEVGEYVISAFGLDGQQKPLYRYDPKITEGGKSVFVTELDSLMALIKDAAFRLNIPKAAPIYLEPLPEQIPLSEVIRNSDTFRLFDGKTWQIGKAERNIIPIGYLDVPQRCLQTPFSLNFNEGGGHLWVIGSPGSGKSAVLLNLAASLSMTHSPDDAHIYVLDFGTGALSCLSALPHTGALIKAHETERIERLFKFLRDEIQRRTEGDWRSEGLPDIYLIVNNVADFRQQYPDQAEEMGRLIRSGGAVGIHMVISSNRGSELPRTLSGNIPRRIVLQLAERQDYIDVLNAMVPPLSLRTEARGYYMAEDVAECQISLPDSKIIPTDQGRIFEDRKAKSLRNAADIQSLNRLMTSLGVNMASISAEYRRPKDILAMQEVLSVQDFEQQVKHESIVLPDLSIPIGLRYEDLSPITVDLGEEVPFWTVLGPRQAGKSVFLMNLLYQTQNYHPKRCKVTYLSLKRGPFSQITSAIPELEVITSPEDSIKVCDDFPASLDKNSGQFRMLLIDDVGLPYLNINQGMVKAFDQLADRLMGIPHGHFLVAIADMVGNLRGGQAYTSSLIKLFQQNQTGIFFSMDDYDMQWFNAKISMQLRKSLTLLPGRGFMVRKGKVEYLQVPFVNIKDINQYSDTQRKI